MKKLILGLMFFLFFDLWVIAHMGGKSPEWLLVSLAMFLITLLTLCFLVIKSTKKAKARKWWHLGECDNDCHSLQIKFFNSLLAMAFFAAALIFYKDLGTFIGKILVVGFFASFVFASLFRPSSWIPFRRLKKCPQCGSHWVDTYYLQGEISVATYPNSQFVRETAPMSYILHCRKCGFEHSSNQGLWSEVYKKKEAKSA